MKGEAKGSYFESGDGKSEETAYVIAKPKQLYYFNWLQDVGKFNEDSDKDGVIDTVYFKLDDSLQESGLDMTGLTLPPAGTSDYPFVGHFNGNGVTINNLTISNAWDELGEHKPNGASQDGAILKGAEIVGFFGIVGEYVKTPSSLTTKDVTDEDGTAHTISVNDGSLKYNVKSVSGDATTYINSINDLYFENLTVKSSASQVLAGFIAGYANGQIDNCGIHAGQFYFANGATSLSDGTLSETSISKYTLIGDYTTNLVWKDRPTGDDDSGGGDATNWGSSIDMMTLNRRMNYISAVSTFSINVGSRYNVDNSTYGYGGITSSSNEMYWKNTGTTYWYVKDGTFLPLSIDTATAFAGDEVTVTPTGIDTSYHTTSYYQNHTSEFNLISSNNSGYLVGRTNGSYADIRTRLQTLSSGLANSAVNSTYDGNIKVYTVDTTSGTSTVDLYQKSRGSVTTNNCETYGYTRFDNVISNFDSFMNGYKVVHGFHMVKVDVTSPSEWAKAPFDIKILGKTYSYANDNYQFIKGCLNFTVAKKGYITTMIDSCYGQSGNNTMFDLFSIERNSDHSIKSVTKIDTIYTDSKGNAVYNPTDTSGLTLAFDFAKVTGSNVFGSSNINKAYYFELPVSAGDYAIGKTADIYMSYLMYLDIGANGNDDSGGSSDTEIKDTNIDFVYKENDALAKITDTGYTPSGALFSITGPTTSTKIISFERKSKQNKDVSETETYIGVAYVNLSGATIGHLGNGKYTDQTSEEEGAS